jgi:hypothetical protein
MKAAALSPEHHHHSSSNIMVNGESFLFPRFVWPFEFYICRIEICVQVFFVTFNRSNR